MRTLARMIGAASTAAILFFGPGGAVSRAADATFPTHPITLFVPYGKGGGSDQLSRAMASSIQETTGVKFNVVNHPGKAGLAVLPEFMSAPADGYTLIEHIDDAVAAFASGNSQVHPGRDWVPLAIVQITFSQIFIRPEDDRFHDWASFLRYAKAHPGRLAIANVSYDGSMEQVNMRRFEQALGFQLRQVSFDQPKERYDALRYGRVDALFEQPGDVRSYLTAGEMKPVLTFFNTRPDSFPDVPTHKEVGADFEALLRFRGFYVKTGVPRDRQTYLEQLFRKGFQSQTFQGFNESKYMHLIDSYRSTTASIQMIENTIGGYRKAYRDMLYDYYIKHLDKR